MTDSLRASAALKADKLAGRPIVDTITLDRQSRYRRRVLLTTDGGRELLLDLPEATYLADGDGLAVEGGAVLVHAHDARALATIAWHLGNRHTPAEITRGAIYIQPDHVLAELVEQLGAHVHRVRRPFEPEGGAYGGKGPLHSGHHHHGGGHHDHTHDHGHSHDHTHDGDRPQKRDVKLTVVQGTFRPDKREP